MENQPITIERIFDAPATKIWKALTENEQLKQWYFQLEDFKAEVGFEFQFTGGPDDRQYLHLCKVTEVIPNQKLTYSWRYDGYPGDSFVTFELFAEGDKTRLVLTHTGIETFESFKADFAKGNFVIGWTDIVNVLLKEYLEK